MVCFVEVFVSPKSDDPGPWAAAILGVLLLRRAIITARQPAAVIAAGCILTALVVAGNHGVINVNRPAWIAVIVLAFICYALWERLERLWNRDAPRT
jgi:hypothetical protein